MECALNGYFEISGFWGWTEIEDYRHHWTKFYIGPYGKMKKKVYQKLEIWLNPNHVHEYSLDGT